MHLGSRGIRRPALEMPDQADIMRMKVGDGLSRGRPLLPHRHVSQHSVQERVGKAAGRLKSQLSQDMIRQDSLLG